MNDINKYLRIAKIRPNNLKNIRLLYEEYKKIQDIPNMIKYLKIIAKKNQSLEEKGITLNEIGVNYYNTGKYSKAIKYFKEVLKIRELHDVLNNISVCYTNLYEFDLAKKYAYRSLEIYNHFIAHRQLGAVLFYEKQYNESIKHYHQSLELNSKQDNIATTYSICFPYLAKKDFENGFKYYENRLIQPPGSEGPLSARLELPMLKLWDTQKECKNLLVVSEQGLGDMVLYFRFVLELADQHPDMNVHYFCKTELSHVFHHNKPNLSVIDSVTDLSLFDYKVYLMSLPYHLKTRSIQPLHESYIKVNPEVDQYWKNKLSQSKKFKVGIAWNGLLDSWVEKNIPMQALKPLTELDIDLVCLKRKHEYADDLPTIDFADHLTMFDLDTHEPFEDTIAIINNLDLVITVDTVTAHLAGAQQAKTWVLLGRHSCWRWFNDNQKVWFNSVELYRNTIRDDWENALTKAAQRIHSEFNIPFITST